MPTLSVSAILHTKETLFESGSIHKYHKFSKLCMYTREEKVLVSLCLFHEIKKYMACVKQKCNQENNKY